MADTSEDWWTDLMQMWQVFKSFIFCLFAINSKKYISFVMHFTLKQMLLKELHKKTMVGKKLKSKIIHQLG